MNLFTRVACTVTTIVLLTYYIDHNKESVLLFPITVIATFMCLIVTKLYKDK